MSHDDRIRQLTDLFIEDLRAPIEASLRQLLAQMMGIASQEQSAAIDESLAYAKAEHQAAIDAAREFERQQRDLAIEALEAELDRVRATAVEEAHAFAAQQRDMALEALEAELVQRHGTALDAALEFASQQRDQALESLEADLLKQHGETYEALRADLAAKHAQELDELRVELHAEHEKALEALRFEMSERHEETLASIALEAEAEHDGRLQALHDELSRDHEAARDALRREILQEHEAERDEARSAAEATLAAACRERDAARASVAELTDQLAAARAQHEQMLELAHAESAAAEQLSAAPEVEARAEEREFELACSERLLAAIRQLDEASTLSDVLSVTIDHVASESLRGSVLLLQAGRLRGWRSCGLGDLAASSIEVPLEGASFVTEAIDRGVPVATKDAADVAQAFPSFPPPPANRVGLALPILVGGRAVALLYVDDGNRETPLVPSNWPEQAEILTRHAGRCLEALTLARANGFAQRGPQEARPVPARPVPAPAPLPVSVREADEAQEEESARRHARLLISEIKLYNETLVEQGRREGNLLALLGSEIERARRLYEEKIPAAVRERVNCFDDEIVRTLAGGDRALLGQVRDGQTT